MKTLPEKGAKIVCMAGLIVGKIATVETAQLEDWGFGPVPYGNLRLAQNGDQLIGENLSDWEKVKAVHNCYGS